MVSHAAERNWLLVWSIAALVFLWTLSAGAGIHTWDVVEVFSNADGTIQYIELLDRGSTGSETGVGNGSLSSGTQSFSWSNGPVAPPTNGKSYLIATADFAALPGAPVPDVIIPAVNVPFFNTGGDTVAFGAIDSFTFGAVPTNGTDAFDDTTGIVPNTPKNYAGVEGSVDASAPSVPSGSIPGLLVIGAMLVGFGALKLNARNATAV